MPSTPAERSEIAQIAALTRSAREPSGTAMTETARRKFWESFETGHECSMCPKVEIDQTLPDAERQRQVTAARSAHFARVRRIGHQAAQAAREARMPARVIADAI